MNSLRVMKYTMTNSIDVVKSYINHVTKRLIFLLKLQSPPKAQCKLGCRKRGGGRGGCGRSYNRSVLAHTHTRQAAVSLCVRIYPALPASLSGTSASKKRWDAVNQCLEFGSTHILTSCNSTAVSVTLGHGKR